MRLWIDTDIGSDVDDALTLAYALRHSEIDVVGISTVFGDVGLRTQIAQALLELEGRADVPIVTGLGAPISARRKGRMFGHEGKGILPNPSPRMEVLTDPSVNQTLEALASAMSAARPEAVLAIGPMTNLGALAREGFRLPPLTIMGGKLTDISIPGASPRIPEWNWWCDPEAVSLILESPCLSAPRVIPIDVTWGTTLPEEDWQSLIEAGPLGRALVVLCEEWLITLKEKFRAKSPRIHLHDPLAAMTLVEPDVCRFNSLKIRMSPKGVVQHQPDGAPVEGAWEVDEG
ncbi:nucleoside hydrolase, partial [Myxococcota bacterium]|nr:nucleoside hydrolase [Myxococcota bacterium]